VNGTHVNAGDSPAAALHPHASWDANSQSFVLPANSADPGEYSWATDTGGNTGGAPWGTL
jgi:hypothetical protein